MRALAIVALSASLSACALSFRLQLSGADDRPSASVSTPSTQSAATAGAPLLGSLLLAYRDELERYCASGALAGAECADHRQHLLDLFRSAAEDEQHRAAERLHTTARQGPLAALAGAILRHIRR